MKKSKKVSLHRHQSTEELLKDIQEQVLRRKFEKFAKEIRKEKYESCS